MQSELDKFLQDHECLLGEKSISPNGTRRFSLKIPDLPYGRDIDEAWIEIPRDFVGTDLARIALPKRYVLNIPHVESSGHLCIDGDPGPISGSSPIERIDQLIDLFYSSFVEPWARGELDNDFSHEAMNYWAINCLRYSTSSQPIVKIYLTDLRSNLPKIYKATYIESKRIIVAGDEPFIASRHVNALSNGTNISKVLIAEIPISFPFIPDNWPKDVKGIERLIAAKLGNSEASKYLRSVGRRSRSIHRVVVFRAPSCSYGYLLPGGPPSRIQKGRSIKFVPNESLIPLKVERLDVGWTTGRDKNPEYLDRQLKHVLIIGAGALGSSVSEQLAKSGVGNITLVDDDLLSSANIGRHTLGLNSVGQPKVVRLADSISVRWPNCEVHAVTNSIQQWLMNHNFKEIDTILDLTGEPEVRLRIDQERRKYKVDLLIAWMEPYVAAAHTCILPGGSFWLETDTDQLHSINAVEWPAEVMNREPACSSTFQSYTSAAAAYAIALTTEAALDLIDNKAKSPTIRHWVRGQKYLDNCYPGLQLKEWAKHASDYDGIIIEEPYG